MRTGALKGGGIWWPFDFGCEPGGLDLHYKALYIELVWAFAILITDFFFFFFKIKKKKLK